MDWPPRRPGRDGLNELRQLDRRARRAERGRAAPLTAEERALVDARRHVKRQIGFLFHAVPYVCTVLFLLLVAGLRPALSVGFFWGIGLASHALAVQAPRLRERLVEREVRRRLQNTVVRERRALEGEHARSLETLSASIAHEIRNPITAAKSLVQQMGEDPRRVENVDYARVALEELDRVERSIAHLLRFAREEPLRVERVRLADAFGAALDLLAERLLRSGVDVVREFDARDLVDGDVEKLRRVAANLIGNALDALENGRTPRPRIEIVTGRSLDGGEVSAVVRDNGPGMDEATRTRVFQPFFTSKEDGTGLGLAIVRKLVEAHGGAIELASSPGAGTELTLRFPAAGART